MSAGVGRLRFELLPDSVRDAAPSILVSDLSLRFRVSLVDELRVPLSELGGRQAGASGLVTAVDEFAEQQDENEWANVHLLEQLPVVLASDAHVYAEKVQQCVDGARVVGDVCVGGAAVPPPRPSGVRSRPRRSRP